jgi:tight adherence protein C
MYVGAQILFAVIPIGIGVGAALMHWVTMLQGCALGLAVGLLGAILPGFWLDAQKRRRQTKISRALPDALDVIVVCVEAGLSVPAAIARVGSELQAAYPLLAAEMLIVQREIQLGLSTGQALQEFADRFDLAELRGLASVVKQAEKFGASIAKALRVHAESMRVKRFQLAEEKAQKATVKLLFPTLFCIFPALYVVLIGPAVFDIIALFQELAKR